MYEINVSSGISCSLLSFSVLPEPDPFLCSQGEAPTGFTEQQDLSQLNWENGNAFFVSRNCCDTHKLQSLKRAGVIYKALHKTCEVNSSLSASKGFQPSLPPLLHFNHAVFEHLSFI